MKKNTKKNWSSPIIKEVLSIEETLTNTNTAADGGFAGTNAS